VPYFTFSLFDPARYRFEKVFVSVQRQTLDYLTVFPGRKSASIIEHYRYKKFLKYEPFACSLPDANEQLHTLIHTESPCYSSFITYRISHNDIYKELRTHLEPRHSECICELPTSPLLLVETSFLRTSLKAYEMEDDEHRIAVLLHI